MCAGSQHEVRELAMHEPTETFKDWRKIPSEQLSLVQK